MTAASLLSLCRKISRKRVRELLDLKYGIRCLQFVRSDEKVGLTPRTPAQNQPARGASTSAMTRKLGFGRLCPNCRFGNLEAWRPQTYLVSRTTLPQLHCGYLTSCPQYLWSWRLHLDSEIAALLMQEKKKKSKPSKK